jgi:hypothetical protein
VPRFFRDQPNSSAKFVVNRGALRKTKSVGACSRLPQVLPKIVTSVFMVVLKTGVRKIGL